MKWWLFAIAVVCLTGCGTPIPAYKPIDAKGQLIESSEYAEIRLVTLEEGTRCVIVLGLYKAAISCDWSQ